MALPRPLARLVAPHRAFGDDENRTSLPVALGLVLLVAVVSTVSFSMAATPIAAAVDGTVTVDNPNRPADFVCQSQTDDGSGWNSDTPEACTEPEQLTRSLAGYAQSAVGGLLGPAFLTVVVGWLLATAWLYTLTGSGDEGLVTTLLGDTAWAGLPFLLPAVARPLVLGRTAETYRYGATIESVETTAVAVASGADSTVLFAVSVAALLWSGAVLVGVAHRRRDLPLRGAGSLVAVPVGILVFAASAQQTPGASQRAFVVGGIMLAFGLPYALFPVALIRLSKRLELIGFRGDVEPEEWYVNLHRYGGLAAACLGFLLVGAPPLVI
ncbi:hypothetical protein SAMN04487949_1991 [Halogranum gelatinilyticum]|uniref:DUF6199 domain-containing protein n=1 Tax=Halogranum gelatinilyticum TaxID=660521 RepID=A0A1G9U0M8_9EURY|nr:hypothetical protein [Halogranum gelatinilyticum]SDM53519.1 hypothetical protein SAMN04487949_1991 [Halogranum gelatinilyticum]